jgi:hypothetical protein
MDTTPQILDLTFTPCNRTIEKVELGYKEGRKVGDKCLRVEVYATKPFTL